MEPEPVIAQPESAEQARFLRPAALTGVEALHATFVTHRYVPHIHDTLTVAHVDRGAATFTLDGERHVAPSGSVFLIPPLAAHTGESAAALGYSYRVLYLEPTALAARSGADTPSSAWRRFPVLPPHPALATALERMHATLRHPHDALEQGDALAGVARALAPLLQSGDEPAPRARHPAVRTAVDYLREHWRENFTLDELAAATSLSTFRLTHLFRAQVGMPPSSYRSALRIQAAQRLLRQGDTPAMAATQCGFYDQAHLNRHFKRITGTTPGQYASAG